MHIQKRTAKLEKLYRLLYVSLEVVFFARMLDGEMRWKSWVTTGWGRHGRVDWPVRGAFQAKHAL